MHWRYFFPPLISLLITLFVLSMKASNVGISTTNIHVLLTNVMETSGSCIDSSHSLKSIFTRLINVYIVLRKTHLHSVLRTRLSAWLQLLKRSATILGSSSRLERYPSAERNNPATSRPGVRISLPQMVRQPLSSFISYSSLTAGSMASTAFFIPIRLIHSSVYAQIKKIQVFIRGCIQKRDIAKFAKSSHRWSRRRNFIVNIPDLRWF